jgi:dipeptidyl aminopeptidase/acylaminoacyl peptidase
MEKGIRLAVITGCLLASAGCARAPEKAGPGNEREPAAETGAADSAAVKAAASAPRYPAEAFFETVTFRGAAFSHDGDHILISSDQTGVVNVWQLPFAGGEAKALTGSETESLFIAGAFPDDGRFLYEADQGGNELTHVFVQEPDGTVRDLTPGENLKAGFLGFSKDGSRFWITSNERDPKFFDLYEYAADDYERRMLFQNDDSWSVQAVSPDGRYVGLVKNRTRVDSDIFLFDTDNPEAELVHVTPHEGNVSNQVLAFDPDGSALYYATDGEGEFRQAWTYGLATGERRPAFQPEWDVVFLFFSDSGRYRVTGVNEDARTRIQILDRETGEPLALPDLPEGDLQQVRFSPDESRMSVYVTSATSPANLFAIDLDGGTARQLTDAMNPVIDPAALVDARIIRYPSFDGLPIPSVLYRPQGASAAAPAPALVWVHGGPGGQSRVRYSATVQFLVNQGYAILMANNRGSSGYGKTFYQMDDRRHGEVDLDDIVEGKEYLAGLDWVDGDRIGIIGGSYGGYMVAAALAFRPDVFDVGINIFGVTNWVRTLQSIPPWWESFREALYDEMGDPATDAERHRRISPLFHAEKITRPLLVVQGANDPRVLQVESDELVAAVRANDVPVEYVLFEDEGHGFLKKENQIAAARAYAEFLAEHMGPDSD